MGLIHSVGIALDVRGRARRASRGHHLACGATYADTAPHAMSATTCVLRAGVHDSRAARGLRCLRAETE